MPDTETYEVYAIRYAHNERLSSANFLGGDSHNVPMPLDYYIWAIVGRKRTFVVDTGFDEEMARKRDRSFLRCPGDGLRAIGIEPHDIRDVIISHLHYDHAGNHHLFPNATYHVQDREMMYVTGRAMCHHTLSHSYECNDVVEMVRRLYAGRIRFHDGYDEIAPGISVHRMGGHTLGIQAIRVLTRSGYLVLASDVSHFYANLEQRRPFPIIDNAFEMLEAYGKLARLASSSHMIVPGHDPLVLKRYPSVSDSLADIVRLDSRLPSA